MSFLRDYTLYASGLESPSIYHTWCALSALGSFLSKKVWTDMNYFKVYPNMYILLVGNPGLKKSTAMNLAKALVRDTGERHMSPAAITKEALMLLMGRDKSPCQFSYEKKPGEIVQVSHLSIFANELVNLLNAGGNPIGMIDLLTDIWDQDPYRNETKNKGIDEIKGPFVHLLGCMTPELIENMLFQRIISGGFTRRCIFVHAERNEKAVPIPFATPEMVEAWERAHQRAKELLNWKGEYLWSPEFKNDLWPQWYCNNFDRTESEPSLVMKGFLRSKPEYILKLMMLINASETDSLILKPASFYAAKAFLDDVEPAIPKIFENTGRNELSPITGAIFRRIESFGKIMKVKTIYAEFSRDASIPEIDQMLDVLVKTDKIKAGQVIMQGQPIKFVGLPAMIDEALANVQIIS